MFSAFNVLTWRSAFSNSVKEHIIISTLNQRAHYILNSPPKSTLFSQLCTKEHIIFPTLHQTAHYFLNTNEHTIFLTLCQRAHYFLNSALNSTSFAQLCTKQHPIFSPTKQHIIFSTPHQRVHNILDSAPKSPLFFFPRIIFWTTDPFDFPDPDPQKGIIKEPEPDPRSDLVFGNFIWFGPIFKRLNKLDFVHSEKCL